MTSATRRKRFCRAGRGRPCAPWFAGALRHDCDGRMEVVIVAPLRLPDPTCPAIRSAAVPSGAGAHEDVVDQSSGDAEAGECQRGAAPDGLDHRGGAHGDERQRAVEMSVRRAGVERLRRGGDVGQTGEDHQASVHRRWSWSMRSSATGPSVATRTTSGGSVRTRSTTTSTLNTYGGSRTGVRAVRRARERCARLIAARRRQGGDGESSNRQSGGRALQERPTLGFGTVQERSRTHGWNLPHRRAGAMRSEARG